MGCGSIRIKHRNLRSVGHIEVYSRRRIEASQTLLDRSHEYLPYGILVFKFYLVFGRVDIDINSFRIHIKRHEIIGLHIGRKNIFVAAHYCLVEKRMAHVAAIDKQILQGIALARSRGSPTKPSRRTIDVSVDTGMS